jgi:hypothetical protein
MKVPKKAYLASLKCRKNSLCITYLVVFHDFLQFQATLKIELMPLLIPLAFVVLKPAEDRRYGPDLLHVVLGHSCKGR